MATKENITRYPSMAQVYQTKHINNWIMYNPDLTKEKFIITEKLTGLPFR